MRTLIKCHSLWLCVMLALLAFGCRRAHGDDAMPVTVTTIVKAWKAREAEAIAFDFRAVGTEFRPKTMVSATWLAMMGEGSHRTELSVPDVSFNLVLRLAIDGNRRARFDYDGKGLAPNENASYPDMRSITIWEGGVQNLFFPYSGLGFPSGHVSKDPKCLAAQSPQILPLMMAYRPLDKDIGVFDVSKLRLIEGTGDARGGLVLRHGESMLWVDRGKGFLPTRYRVISQGVTEQSIDLTYASDTKHGWVPKSWNQVTSPGGKILNSCTVEVVEYKLGDGAVSDDTFAVTYPPGTWVRDYIQDQSWIVREDGSRRMVLKSEDGKAYDDLMATDTAISRRSFLWIGVPILLIGILMVFIYRRLKYRRRAAIGS